MSPIVVENQTRRHVLVTTGRMANTMWARLRGLIGSRPLAQGEGLLILPSRSVHTHFMGFPIDVIYVNASDVVVGIDSNLVPWRFGRFYRHVRFIIELPAGTAESTGTEVGDQLRITGRQT